jgi:TPP-dependent pyruvate/acetoin dehydrogenase alpha subunit
MASRHGVSGSGRGGKSIAKISSMAAAKRNKHRMARQLAHGGGVSNGSGMALMASWRRHENNGGNEIMAKHSMAAAAMAAAEIMDNGSEIMAYNASGETAWRISGME